MFQSCLRGTCTPYRLKFAHQPPHYRGLTTPPTTHQQCLATLPPRTANESKSLPLMRACPLPKLKKLQVSVAKGYAEPLRAPTTTQSREVGALERSLDPSRDPSRDPNTPRPGRLSPRQHLATPPTRLSLPIRVPAAHQEASSLPPSEPCRPPRLHRSRTRRSQASSSNWIRRPKRPGRPRAQKTKWVSRPW